MDSRRQKQITIGLISLITVLGGIFIFALLLRGESQRMLPGAEVLPPAEKPALKNLDVVFADFFAVRKYSTYDAVAFVRNPNFGYGASEVSYEFTFLDINSEKLHRVVGKAFVLPGESRYIIEPAVKVPGEPSGVTFRIMEAEWRGLGPFSPAGLEIKDIDLKPEEDARTVRFSGVVYNGTPYNLKNVEVHVVLYDSAREDRPVAAGTTNMQLLLRDTARAFQIVWPYALPANLRIDARVESNFFENSNFIRDYGRPETFREYY